MLWAEYLCSSKIHMLNPNLYCDGIWRWGLRPASGALLVGLLPHHERQQGAGPLSTLLPSASQGGTVTRPRSAGYFDLRLPSLPKEVSEMGQINGFWVSPLLYGIIVIATQTKTPDLFQHKFRSEQVLTHFS